MMRSCSEPAQRCLHRKLKTNIYTPLSDANNQHKCKCAFRARPRCSSVLAITLPRCKNLVWWKLHIVRLPNSSHWRRPRRPLMAFNMCAQAWDPDPFGRGDPLGVSGVTQSLTTALRIQRREPSFHSGTVSAKWTPRTQCAASPRLCGGLQRIVTFCVASYAEAKKEVCFIASSIFLPSFNH